VLNFESDTYSSFLAHREMVRKNVLHGDLSLNNFIIHKGQGYFIDFDHAQIITQGNTSVRSRGTVSQSWKFNLV
jgi:serine/threonine-protein kinase RIO1